MLVVHNVVANATILYLVIAAVWGFLAFLRGRGIEGNYWGILGIAESLFLIQAIVGIILLLSGASPGRGVHYLYGAVGAVSLPGYYALTKGRGDRSAALAYGILCLFLAGIASRAIGTA